MPNSPVSIQLFCLDRKLQRQALEWFSLFLPAVSCRQSFVLAAKSDTGRQWEMLNTLYKLAKHKDSLPIIILCIKKASDLDYFAKFVAQGDAMPQYAVALTEDAEAKLSREELQQQITHRLAVERTHIFTSFGDLIYRLRADLNLPQQDSIHSATLFSSGKDNVVEVELSDTEMDCNEAKQAIFKIGA